MGTLLLTQLQIIIIIIIIIQTISPFPIGLRPSVDQIWNMFATTVKSR